jgi:hypothetical protein
MSKKYFSVYITFIVLIMRFVAELHDVEIKKHFMV